MYDGVVSDEDDNDFDVPKKILENILNCYSTQFQVLFEPKGSRTSQ